MRPADRLHTAQARPGSSPIRSGLPLRAPEVGPNRGEQFGGPPGPAPTQDIALGVVVKELIRVEVRTVVFLKDRIFQHPRAEEIWWGKERLTNSHGGFE